MWSASSSPSPCRALSVFFYLEVNGVGNNPFSRAGWGCGVGPLNEVAAAQSLEPRGELRNKERVKTSLESQGLVPKAERARPGRFPASKGQETRAAGAGIPKASGYGRDHGQLIAQKRGLLNSATAIFPPDALKKMGMRAPLHSGSQTAFALTGRTAVPSATVPWLPRSGQACCPAPQSH